MNNGGKYGNSIRDMGITFFSIMMRTKRLSDVVLGRIDHIMWAWCSCIAGK